VCATLTVAASLLLGACGVPVAPTPPAASGVAASALTTAPGTSVIPPSSPAPTPSPTPSPSPLASPSSSPSSSPTPAYSGPWPLARWCRAGGAGAPVHDDVQLPILYYHRVEAPPAAYATWSSVRRREFLTYDTLPQAFALQLDWLASNGYTTILPGDLAAHWSHGCRLPTRPVILTFDDGTPDWLSTVLPLLHAHGMVAEFYVTLDAIAGHAISWADVKTLAANGMGIGAHDVHHRQLTMLGGTRKPATSATMWFEVDEARLRIGARIGAEPDSMAYVGGGFDATLISLVRRAGYATARSIRHGVVQRWADRFALRVVRIGVYDDVTDRTVWAIDPAVPVFAAKVTGRAD
jgi:peptidoglycan/xylan/chitin deacetylase (PgdA/CDA1 family)